MWNPWHPTCNHVGTMRSLSLLMIVAASLVACGSSSDDATTGDDENVTKDNGKHDVFVCQGSDTSVGKGIFMFAHDPKGTITNATKEGYCPIATDSNGLPFGKYWCWVGDTVEAKTTDGQIAILFNDNLGDGAHLYHQLNLPKDLLTKKAGSGKLRLLSRSPKDLTTPITSGDSVETIDCKLQSLTFPKS